MAVSHQRREPGMAGPTRSIVVCGLWLNGASVVRQLTALGYDTWAVSSDPNEVGWHGACGKKLLCPDPSVARADWIAFMMELGRTFDNLPGLIPCSDAFVVALDAAASSLATRYRFHGFGTGLHTALTSKRSTFALAEQYDFPRPLTQYVTSRDALAEFAQKIQGRGVLIKPDFPPSWHAGEAARVAANRKVMTGANLDQLLRAYDSIAPYTPGVVAQEVIPGPDSNLVYWCGFVRQDGKVAGRLVGRKMRTLPIHFGRGSYVHLVDHAQVERNVERFLSAINFYGLCGVELKEDPDDGIAKLIEINPRYGLWDDIGIPVGVDLAGEAAASLFGETPSAARPRHFRQKWVALSMDVDAFRSYRAEGLLSAVDWIRSLTPPIRINDLPFRRDLPYALYHLRRLGHRLGSKLVSRLRWAAHRC